MPPSPAAVTEGTPADIREWTTRSEGPTPRDPIDGCKVSRTCLRSGLLRYFAIGTQGAPAGRPDEGARDNDGRGARRCVRTDRMLPARPRRKVPLPPTPRLHVGRAARPTNSPIDGRQKDACVPPAPCIAMRAADPVSESATARRALKGHPMSRSPWSLCRGTGMASGIRITARGGVPLHIAIPFPSPPWQQ